MTTHVYSIHPDVESEVSGALGRVWCDHAVVRERVRALEERFGNGAYAQVVYLLVRLEFPPEEAKEHWERAHEHAAALGKELSRDVDFRVALFDYFLGVQRHLKNPTIVDAAHLESIENASLHDELTGLYDYRHFRCELDREIAKAARARRSLSLVLIDVDDFGSYNAQNGREAGDRLLRGFSQLLKNEARESDVIARYGGGEFAVLLPEATKPQATQIAERIRQRVMRHSFPHGGAQPGGRLTVSAGVACYRADARDAPSLLEAAETALYLAKGSGKNRVLGSGFENREYPRLGVKLLGTLLPFASSPQPFFTTDISEQGFRISCEAPLEEGAYFRFRLLLPTGGEQVEGVARVIRVDDLDGRYELGARIVETSFRHADRLREYLASCRKTSDAGVTAVPPGDLDL